jgi:predicted dehydrogenase
MRKMNRRSFLKSSAEVAAAFAMTTKATRVLGANDEVRVAVMGFHGQGKTHIREFLKMKPNGVDLAALCDIDEEVLNRAAAEVEKVRGKKPEVHTDIRKLLEDKSINAVSMATPNHWHALGTIWTCQAGKDVYVEKPASWCIREGRKMVEAARKYNRIVQVGTMNRSNQTIRKAIAQLHAGIIGDVYMARGLCFKRRDSIGFKEPSEPPKNIHYDLWLGPGPQQPYHANLVHYNWHWFWDFGNGDIGNQGIHQMDLARWGINKGMPIKASSMGGRYGYKDQGQTPNTQVATLTYEDGKMVVFEVRGRWTNDEKGERVGNLFYGSEGCMADWKADFGYGGKAYGGKAEAEVQLPKVGGDGKGNHYENFIAAVRSRNVKDLNCDVMEGHQSAVLFHLANISYRLGRIVTFDPKTEAFVGDGAKEANALLTREYRKPFVVPEEV